MYAPRSGRPRGRHGSLESAAAAAAIATRPGLHAAGRTSATTGQRRALLLTFVNCQGADPTNSESERMQSKAATAKKIRIASVVGAWMFSNMTTCVLT